MLGSAAGLEEDSLEDRIREMLRDFGRALSEAIAESSDVNQALRRLREEGYGLIILLDRRRDSSSDRAEPASSRRALPPATSVERPALPPGPPVFRIDGSDLSFLKSIGIDPTRRVRGRRSGPRHPPLDFEREADPGLDSGQGAGTDPETGPSSE